ncbi:5-oxoprolinase (ATP-hydrolyzing) [Altererythrobacter atlanticus]|uniref:Acetophenone carboxylase gamma subunit n=1 Tax=Croceibacterium atlanticum TaxID=1267766 RepID=A0A0F7KXQ3_9SPHN|nr:hydantoinase B/oxoprolinase family protein [Croceibacterium atlanticum]AKH43997.1 Acetophenone carboxylase gamma subunit [Croceibacterium atlanticum]MBB5732303.1 5-oxoprolinase (ATP-hydrolyzing) [Croceibacterium atlanticum]
MTWQFWIDRGGTFTDVVARDGAGELHRMKLLSDNPEHYADAASEAMRRLTGTPAGPLPPSELRLGTTVATNALLERKGEPVLLAITRGLGDALRIGTQERPDIFAREIVLPDPLYADIAEMPERIGPDGAIIHPLDEDGARQRLQAAHDRGLRAVAIVLMHGYRYPAHEQRLAEIAAEIGFTQISTSHRVAPLIKLIARGDTSVVDAYLSPVLHRYIAGLEAGMGPAVRALYMQSSGGLAEGNSFHGKDAILSGPAGGIVGMAAAARSAGLDQVVGFDMGGTSTDVSHWAGAFERDSETRVEGQRIRAPMMRIHTVAAGGGSICRFAGGRFQVGPESAGAVPGPACYRRGGPLTVTDCNLILGRLQPDYFPSVFGPHADQPPSLADARARMEEVIAGAEAATGQIFTPEQAAEGFLAIAVANMANAIKAISLRRGHDVTRAALLPFGGAGGQHACRVADALGITEILCHPLASVLSAYGMGLADRRALREVTVDRPLDGETLEEVNRLAETLGTEAEAELAPREEESAHRELSLFLRPPGAQSTIEVPPGSMEEIAREFDKRWRAQFGFGASGQPVVDMLRVEAIVSSGASQSLPAPDAVTAPEPELVRAFIGGENRQVPVYSRGMLPSGFTRAGPALVIDDTSTYVVEPDWDFTVDQAGNLLLSRSRAARGHQESMTSRDPVKLEIMASLFMAVAEEMGAALQHSARSVNIRERLDFSCALFDREGALIANAPHMPVHLGSMGESVRTIMANRGNGSDRRGMRPGDAYALNAPYAGGTHLPDITVVMPVFAEDGDAQPAWFVAARGHHADIGGIAPGSMPSQSRSVEDEGILLDDVLLVDEGDFREQAMRDLLSAGPHPARNIEQNIADLQAQVASCTRGARELRRIAAEQTRATLDAYMGHAQDAAEEAVRELLKGLTDGTAICPMDNGAQIHVAITVDAERGEAVIDFTGTSGQLPDNFNAPLPVVRAAVLYVLRTMVDAAIPMNEGCLRPVRITVPVGSMLNPRYPAAVVAGNVETSQIITDALFAAFGAMAASQGTMNNLSFGNESHQYYETIAGGAGAGQNRDGSGFPGASAVQTHMTNSRLTDPEVLEAHFPVRLEEFAIRQGSGGAGKWQGGDGVRRAIRFLEPMEASILSGRRLTAPFGLAGGEDAGPGTNRVIRADGTAQELGPTATVTLETGDMLVIETPGGGGFGAN